MWAYILAHENAVPLWRSLMGPTKVFRARNSVPDSIRGAYGLTDTRNTTHGSGRPVLGWVLGKDWSSGRCEWWYFVCLCLLSVLGVNVNDLLTSADSTHTCPGVTKPDAFPDGFCPSLWNIAPTYSARLASLIFFFLCFLTDSPASASREIAFFFPEFNEQLWYQQEEPRLRCGQVYYNAEERVHCIVRNEEKELTWVTWGYGLLNWE